MIKSMSLIILFSFPLICNLYVFGVKGTDTLEINDNDFEMWNINSNNLLISNEMTYSSWRRLIEIPFNSKRQIVKIETIVQTGNEEYIENINLFRCSSFDDRDKYEWIANKIIIDSENKNHLCHKLLAKWSPKYDYNKNILLLPNSMGIPIGDLHNEKYLLLEINYINHKLISGLSDSSGFRLYIDKQNREFDADIVAVGSVPDFRFFIPPKLEEWTITGNCYKECLQEKLKTEEINIINVLNYGRHELLEEMKVEILKSGRNSRTYVYNSKENTYNQNEIKLEKRDQLTVKCRFNSSKQNKTVLGGFARNDSQCIAWILYYPKVNNFDACLSSFSLSTIMSITGIEELEETWRTQNNFDVLIKYLNTNKTERLENYLNGKSDWDYNRLNRAKYVAQFGKQIAQCNWQRSIIDEIV